MQFTASETCSWNIWAYMNRKREIGSISKVFTKRHTTNIGNRQVLYREVFENKVVIKRKKAYVPFLNTMLAPSYILMERNSIDSLKRYFRVGLFYGSDLHVKKRLSIAKRPKMLQCIVSEFIRDSQKFYPSPVMYNVKMPLCNSLMKIFFSMKL